MIFILLFSEENVFKTILKIVAERKKVISTKIYKILKAE
jgi:hypothetical protein